MKNNLLYHGDEDEPKVVNTFKNVLNRLSPEARATFFDELAGVSVSSTIIREESTKISTPTNTVLVGLAGDPTPISLEDLSPRDGGGQVDLYAEDEGNAVIVEAKLGNSLNKSQLERYATALSPDEVVTVSWSKVFRTIENLEEIVHPKRQFLIEDLLEYIAELGLHQDSITFDHYWGDKDGYKYMGATKDTVIFYSTDHHKRGKTDRRPLTWEQFRTLFEDIENNHGRSLVESIFVDIKPLHDFFESDVVLGEIDSIQTEDNLLRLFYQESDKAIKLREIQRRNESPPAPGRPAGPSETYVWLMNFNDQKGMLRTHSRAKRKQIFVTREWSDWLVT